jgi:hypothetical protein
VAYPDTSRRKIIALVPQKRLTDIESCVLQLKSIADRREIELHPEDATLQIELCGYAHDDCARRNGCAGVHPYE